MGAQGRNTSINIQDVHLCIAYLHKKKLINLRVANVKINKGLRRIIYSVFGGFISLSDWKKSLGQVYLSVKVLKLIKYIKYLLPTVR